MAILILLRFFFSSDEVFVFCRALDDIKESIAELAFYREKLFIKLE